MVAFSNWCDITDQVVNTHNLKIMTVSNAQVDGACSEVAAIVPNHYASEERIAELLARLGKPAAAQFIRDSLPQDKRIRSGDLGEILGTEYVREMTEYDPAINRLRWKDHRNMAMRGDDVIGIKQRPNTPLNFLKCEIKSRASLSTDAVTEARSTLDSDDGLPSPHALAFIANRLHEESRHQLANAIDDTQLNSSIRPEQVAHLLFTFSGSNPTNLLEADLQNYVRNIPQNNVGLRIVTHQNFIGAVYDRVISNANNS